MNVLSRSLVPLVVVSGGGLLLSAGYFAAFGYLSTVWMPVLLTMSGWVLFPFVLFPAGILAGLWNAVRTRPGLLPRILGGASIAYLAAVLALTLAIVGSLSRALPGEATSILKLVFSLCGAVAPWAVFALRDRDNQLFILLLWALVIAACALLPAFVRQAITPLAYAGAAWVVMLLLVWAEQARQDLTSSSS